jgi:hypothetical protein
LTEELTIVLNREQVAHLIDQLTAWHDSTGDPGVTNYPTVPCREIVRPLHLPHRYMLGSHVYQCPGEQTASGTETARAVLHTTITAPNPANAARWAENIRDLVHAEFGGTMRLHTSIELETPGRPLDIPAAAEQQCGEECAEGHVYAGHCAQAAPEQYRAETGPVDPATARVFAALHRSAEDTVTRVIDLAERWTAAGPPLLGTAMARWWDTRLIELRNAINPAPGQRRPDNPADTCHCGIGTHAECATGPAGCGPVSRDEQEADTAPDDGLREQLAAAIREATCSGHCGQTEDECASTRIQPVVWHFGELAEVSGAPEMIADVVLPVITRHTEQLRADLRNVLDYDGNRHSHAEPGIWDDSGLPCGHCARLNQARRHLNALDQPETDRA